MCARYLYCNAASVYASFLFCVFRGSWVCLMTVVPVPSPLTSVGEG